jgi:hypothetical protein
MPPCWLDFHSNQIRPSRETPLRNAGDRWEFINLSEPGGWPINKEALVSVWQSQALAEASKVRALCHSIVDYPSSSYLSR